MAPSTSADAMRRPSAHGILAGTGQLRPRQVIA